MVEQIICDAFNNIFIEEMDYSRMNIVSNFILVLKEVTQVFLCFIAACFLFWMVFFFTPSLLSKDEIPPEKICTYDYPCFEQS